MAEQLQVIITGKDNVSRVFQEVSKSAKTAGDSIERAGKEGEQGFKRLGDSADKAEKEVRDVGDSAKRTGVDLDGLGVAITAVGAALVYASDRALEEERQIIGLQNAFGDAADEMIRFADELDAITIFDDDDIRAGERYFASLRNNYDLSIQQIQDLMRTTADLASAAGISFEDASSRVTAAIRGEAEAAEYLGLTLNQAAIDREGLTLTMSNQEAAQFRLNALNQQAAVYVGTAAELQATAAGTAADWSDRLNDAAASVGSFIGPMGSMVSGLGLGIAGLAQMVGGLGRFSGALRTAGAASLRFAATPLGLAITGVGAALAIATFAFQRNAEEARATEQAYEDLQGAIKSVDDLVANLRLGGDFTLAARLTADIEDARRQLDAFEVDLGSVLDFSKINIDDDDVAQQVYDFLHTSVGLGVAKFAADEGYLDAYADSINMDVQDVVQAIADGNVDALEGVAPILRSAATDYYAQMELTDSQRADIEQSLQPLFDLYSNPNINVDRLDAQIESLFQRFRDGEISAKGLTVSLDGLFKGITFGSDQYNILNGEVSDLNAEWKTSLDILSDLDPRLARHFGLMTEEARKANADSAAAEGSANRAREATGNWWIEHDRRASAQSAMNEEMLEANEVMSEQANILGGVLKTAQQGAADAAAEHTARLEALNTASSDATAATLEMAAAAQQAQADFIAAGTALAGWDDALSQLNMAGFGTEAMLLADGLGQATTALDNTFRIVVGNTNAIGQQVQGVEDWITALGETNDVLNEQIAISVANANVQEDLLSIQAQQAPLVAEQTLRTAAYVDELERMPAAQQAVALGWMDANTAAQANEAVMIAAAAANGEWGASGEEAAAQFIEGAIAANPILEDLLTDLELVSRDREGNLVINFDGAEGARSEIDLLNESIRLLADILDDNEINGSIGVQVTGRDAVDQLTGAIEEAMSHDGDNAHVTASGDVSNATSAIAVVADSLRNLDGDNAHVTNTGDNSDATNAIANTSTALNALDGDSATVYAYLSDFASAGISGIRGALNGLDGRTATAYIDTVYRSYGVGPTAMHGGIPEFAMGGVTARMGEAGPEMLHFAGGGTAWAPNDGLYTVPPMTYVSPAPASASTGSGGHTFNITVNGGNRDEIRAVFANEIVPMIGREMTAFERSQGVR